MTTTYRILRSTSDSCVMCKAQKKALTIERFADLESLKITEQVCAAEQEEMKIPSKAEAYRLSEEYDVRAFPVVVIEAKLDGGGSVEIYRAEGNVSLAALRKAHKEAMEEFVVRTGKETAPWL